MILHNIYLNYYRLFYSKTFFKGKFLKSPKWFHSITGYRLKMGVIRDLFISSVGETLHTQMLVRFLAALGNFNFFVRGGILIPHCGREVRYCTFYTLYDYYFGYQVAWYDSTKIITKVFHLLWVTIFR